MSNDKEKLHQEKMLLAEFYFCKEDFEDIKEFPGLYLPEYDIDRNPLHRVWEKFRELRFEDLHLKTRLKHANLCQAIAHAMAYGTIADLYNALVNAVKWYNEVKK